MSKDISSLDAYWSDYYEEDCDFVAITPQELKKILACVPYSAPKNALDVGCGTGQLTRELYHSGYKVIELDVSRAAIKIARSLSAAPQNRLLYLHRNIEQEDSGILPFQPYGLITCRLVYAFIENKKELLALVEKLLHPKGTFILITPLLDDVPDNKKEIAVDYTQTRTMLKNYFEVTDFKQNGLDYFVCKMK